MTDFTSGYTTLLKKQWRALVYDYDAMTDGIGEGSKLYCLTNFEAMWLQQNIDYMRWSTRWNNLSISSNDLGILADRLELALMTCVDIQPFMIEFNYDRAVDEQLEGFNTAYDLGGIAGLNPNSPTTDFSGDASPERVLALCGASNVYVRSYAQNWVVKAQIVLGVTLITSIIASISIVGGIIAGTVLAGLALITQTALDAMNDSNALDAVICCMSDNLNGTAVSHVNFQASLDSCGFVVGSNEAIIRDIIASDLDQFDNYLSFINALGDQFVLAENGVDACICPVIASICFDMVSVADLSIQVGSQDGTFGNPLPSLIGVYVVAGATYHNIVQYVFSQPVTVKSVDFDHYQTLAHVAPPVNATQKKIFLFDENDVLLDSYSVVDSSGYLAWSNYATPIINVADVKKVRVQNNYSSTGLTGETYIDNLCISYETI